MNARVETPATEPRASSKHDALVLDVGARLQAIGRQVVESTELHSGDQADLLGQLLDQLHHEYMRLSGAREVAFEFAGIESAEAAESEWERTHEGVDR